MNIVCFHNPDEDNGYLSNWYPSSFTVDSVAFSSMEQFMMYRKAICFGDEAVAAQILSTSDVAKIKSLGRQVSNYDESMWNGIRQIVVYEGLLAKFSQNEELKAKLKATGNAVLAECAVKDRIWGIGLSMKDPDRLNKAKWNGQNLLGYALMMVRERLQQDYSWEQRKLGELVDVCSGRDYKHLSEGTIPVYGTGGYMLSVNDALSYDRDAIGIGRKGTIDRPYILKAPFWTVDTLFYAIPREKVDLNFAFDIFQNIDWKKKDESTGVPSLSKTAINDIDVLAPKHDEQQTIGQFFAALDDLITLHQRKQKQKSPPIMASLVIYGSICFDCFMSVSNTS